MIVAAALALGVATARAHLPTGTLVDLTHPFDAATITWPTEPGFVLEKGHDGETDAGYYYAANRLRLPEHGGTHLDAPLHFHRGGAPVDALALEQLVGPGVVVDVTAQARDPDYQVRIDDFRAWEQRHGRMPPRPIVLLRTGFGAFWPDRRRYLGTDARGPDAVRALHFPGLHPDAARWLVRERAIRAIGLDTASIDHGQSTRFEAHVALFAAGVPAFENVAHLERLPPTGFTVIALPMKIAGGSGAPLRIIAVLDTGPTPTVVRTPGGR